jgi:hypothetical protein
VVYSRPLSPGWTCERGVERHARRQIRDNHTHRVVSACDPRNKTGLCLGS